MFQTDINHFLQSFSAPWLDAFMMGVSWAGEQTFIVGFLCLVALGIDLKRGFLLVQIFLITIIATDILKTSFLLPRPFFVDDTLMSFGALKDGMSALSGGAASSFYAGLSEQSIAAFRSFDWKPDEYGLPSGHTAGAVALWGGLAVVFRKKRLALFAVTMIFLMMISRLYLARHFLADVLTGLSLALFVLVAAAVLLNRLSWQKLFLPSSYSFTENRGAPVLLAIGFVLPSVLLFTGEGLIGRIAGLLAVNFALIGLVWIEISLEPGNIWQRVLRVVLGVGLYVALNAAVKMIPMAQDGLVFQAVKGFVPVFILFFVAPALVSFTLREKRVKFQPAQH